LPAISERAKARGVKLGRKPKLTEHQRREAIRRREEGERVRDIARSYNVSHSTISRLPLPGAPHAARAFSNIAVRGARARATDP
jgi:DNA invertase Pin-like site-specific DNA recombinase